MAQRALTPSKAAYCSECGAETPQDAASCARCGEPFEGMLERRKQRLEQMEALIERAQARIKTLEGSEDPEHVKEREDLKRQIETLLLEKEDILKLEEGLVDMETTYRNILRMQKEEVKARETTLRGRSSASRHELESRDEPFGQSKAREWGCVRGGGGVR